MLRRAISCKCTAHVQHGATPVPIVTIKQMLKKEIQGYAHLKQDHPAVYYDLVSEIERTIAKLEDYQKLQNDPLEQYCFEEPAADECRIHDN